MHLNEILQQLPYSKPFLFVDELFEINQDGVRGAFTFYENLEFYKGHFKENPITPGVILTECCAQIGLVCLGMYLLGKDSDVVPSGLKIGMSSSAMEFLLPVFPGETVTVTSIKNYFRFHKLQCAVKMHNAQGQLVCKGEISGMVKIDQNG